MAWCRRVHSHRSFFQGFAGLLLACSVAFLPGCGNGETDKTEDKTKSDKTKTDSGKKSGKPSTPKEEVYAALDGAIAAIKKRDVRALIENYMPIEVLQRMRRRKGGIGKMVKEIKENPKELGAGLDEMLPMFENARKATPTFNSDKTIARFKNVSSPGQVIKADNLPLLAEKNKAPTVTGYGSDLKAAIKHAAADLEADKVTAYLSNMLPVSELKLNDVGDLAKRLTAAKQVTKQMIADLKSLDGQTPKMEDDGNVAVYRIAVAGTKTTKVAKVELQQRVFKFQKEGGHWRLFDNTTPLQKASAGLSRKLKEISTTFVMEKFGNQWRMASEDAFSVGGKTVREDKTDAKTVYKTDDERVPPKKSIGPDPKPDRKKDERSENKTSPDKN